MIGHRKHLPVRALGHLHKTSPPTTTRRARPPQWASPASRPIVDITNTDTGDIATAVPAEWPVGDYTIYVSVKDINGRSTSRSDYSFTVDATDETTDPGHGPEHSVAARHAGPVHGLIPSA